MKMRFVVALVFLVIGCSRNEDEQVEDQEKSEVTTSRWSEGPLPAGTVTLERILVRFLRVHEQAPLRPEKEEFLLQFQHNGAYFAERRVSPAEPWSHDTPIEVIAPPGMPLRKDDFVGICVRSPQRDFPRGWSIETEYLASDGSSEKRNTARVEVVKDETLVVFCKRRL